MLSRPTPVAGELLSHHPLRRQGPIFANPVHSNSDEYIRAVPGP